MVVLLRLTADKREIKDFHKLPSATSGIRKTVTGSGFKKYLNKFYYSGSYIQQ